jgi:hypothetical protein
MKHVHPPETDDVTAALRDARRNVAIAKLNQYATECDYLGALAERNPNRKAEIVDTLHDIAVSNGLAKTHGDDLVGDLIAAALSGAA